MSAAPVTLDFSKAQPINQSAAQGVTLDFSKAQPIAGPGEQINDVGNKVIVPAEGESFADTMKRAAAYGKTVTQGQINGETATAPAKAATVALSALGGGAALPAAEAGAAAAPWSGVATALAPIAKKYGVKALEGMSLGAGYEVYHALRKYFEGQ
jgi:hypothetical protein